MPRTLRAFSEIYLEKILFGRLVFDVTMATDFWQAVSSENGKSLFKNEEKLLFLRWPNTVFQYTDVSKHYLKTMYF